MRRMIAAGFVLSTLHVTTAYSADAVAEPPLLPAAAPVAEYDWTGLYVGGYLGYAFEGDTTWTNTFNTTALVDYLPGQSDSHTMDGFLGGGQIGYNFQNGNFVFGPELTIGGGDIDASSVATFGVADDVVTTNLDWVATAVARVGFANDNWLIYFNGGWAGGQVDMSIVDTTGINQGTWSDDAWHNGYTLGAGVEYAMGQAIFGVEYRFMDLGTKSHSATASTGGVASFNVDVSQIHSVVGRISWKFN